MGQGVNGNFNNVIVELRRNTNAFYAFNNPVLAAGEPAYEIDTRKLKIGDGITPYNSLPYFGTSGGSAGTVTSVNAVVAGASLSVSGGPITGSGTFSFSWLGSNSQFVLGDGSLGSTIPASAVQLTVGRIGFGSATNTLTSSSNLFYDAANVILYVGGSAGAFPMSKVHIVDSVNGFSQLNYINSSNGNTASSDLVVTADTGTQTTNFSNFGINNSGNSDPTFTIGAALDGYLYTAGGNQLIGTSTANNINFFTGGTSSSNLVGQFVNGIGFLVGGRTAFGVGAIFGATISNYFTGPITGGTVAYGLYTDQTVQSGVTTSAQIYTTAVSTVASAFTLLELAHFSANLTSIGSGSAITTQEGFKVSASVVGATNNYAFRGLLAAATGRWNTFMDGTAQNYFSGSVGIGIGVSVPATKLQVLSTTEQLRLNFDLNNYLSTTVSSTGGVTVLPTGTGTSYTVNKVIITQPTTSATLTLVTGSSLITAGAFALTLTSTATTNATFPAGTGTLTYLAGINAWTALNTFSGGLTVATANATITDVNVVLGTTTGTQFGTATTQKLAFYGSTPIVQPLATTDLGTVLSNLGLRVAGTAYPITTSGAVNFTGGLTVATTGMTITDVNVALSATTGTQFGTATTQKLAFYNSTPIVQPSGTLDLGVVLSNLGLRVATSAYLLTCSGATTLTGNFSFTNAQGGYVAKAALYTIALTDYMIDCNGTFTVTLPTAVGNTGRIFIIRNAGAGTITIACNGAQTINGVTTKTLSVKYTGFQVMADGANFTIIGSF